VRQGIHGSLLGEVKAPAACPRLSLGFKMEFLEYGVFKMSGHVLFGVDLGEMDEDRFYELEEQISELPPRARTVALRF
jgi:hypothetical protein